MKTTLAIAKGIAIGAAMIAVAVLAGCAEYPIAIKVDSSKGGLAYSRSSGLSVTINAQK